MIIVEKNEGTKVPYTVDDTKVTFNDELTINLSKYERDFEQHLDICMDSNRCLSMGLASSYIAQIDIPARQYENVVNGKDENDNDIITKNPLPLNMSLVTLTLWKVEA